jgi:hypothetical protein
MEDYLIYIAKVSIATFVFYLAFLLLFQNRKQFVFNRLFLPVSFLISYLIPLIPIPVVRTVEMTSFEMTGPVFSSTQAAETKVEALFPIEWHQLLLGIYLLGLCGFLFQLILGNLKAFRIIQKSRKGTLFGMPVNLTIQDVHPFAFFNRIVISENTLASPDIEMIVTHENIHVKENHTLDVILTELLFLFQWFNPFAWLIKDAVKNNLEYKTDHQVVQKFNPKTYQLAMVSLADKSGVTPFLNSLNGSQLKNRIIMMKSKKENKYAIVKQLAVIPLLAFLVITLANREVKSEVIPAISQNTTNLGNNALLSSGKINENKNQNLKLSVDDKVYPANDVTEKAKFSNGEWSQWIGNQLKHFSEGKPNGWGFTIKYSIVIDKTGKVRDGKIIKGSDYPEINTEFKRILTQIPDWTPAKKNGVAVNVMLTEAFATKINVVEKK